MRQFPSSAGDKGWIAILTIKKDGGKGDLNTTPGSIGERARGRSERNGSCIFRGCAWLPISTLMSLTSTSVPVAAPHKNGLILLDCLPSSFPQTKSGR